MPSAMVAIAVMPVMAVVLIAPRVTMARFVMVPPTVRMERQSDMREMHSRIGVPAVAGAVADDKGGRTTDAAK